MKYNEYWRVNCSKDWLHYYSKDFNSEAAAINYAKELSANNRGYCFKVLRCKEGVEEVDWRKDGTV